MNMNKKVIYYYYDEAGNRRPIDVDDLKSLEFQSNKQVFKKTKEYYPKIENNYYAQIDGKEFKLF